MGCCLWILGFSGCGCWVCVLGDDGSGLWVWGGDGLCWSICICFLKFLWERVWARGEEEESKIMKKKSENKERDMEMRREEEDRE